MAEATAIAPRGRPFKVAYQPGFTGMAIFCLLVLYAPLVVMVIYSFNDNRSVVIWTEFSWRWYVEAAHNEQVIAAALLSLKVAFVATTVATVAATMAGLATTRVRPYRGLPIIYAIINQPLMVPEIVTAVATLTFFALIKQLTGLYGVGYLMLAHTVFCIPFAYLPIRARLENMDLTYEQVAADLYATPWRVFRRVTLPLMLPGIIAGAMLAFVISLDDVIISLLVAGPGETTLPVYILGQLRRGVTPEVNAVSTVVLAVSTLFVTLFFFFAFRKKG